jgi:hypothetical protein
MSACAHGTPCFLNPVQSLMGGNSDRLASVFKKLYKGNICKEEEGSLYI